MKTKSILSFAALALLALVFQGCPGPYKGPDYDSDIYAYIYSPADSVYTRYYRVREDGTLRKEEATYAPLNGVTEVRWYGALHNDTTLHDSEYHYLHVRKLSNQNPAYVLRNAWVELNGNLVLWRDFPSKYYYKEEDKKSLPFIEDVIDTLFIYYPDAVVPINDLEEHSIYNDKYYANTPSISIDY